MEQPRIHPFCLLLISALALYLVAPSHLALFTWSSSGLTPSSTHVPGFVVPVTPPTDLDGNGLPEVISTQDGKVEIHSESTMVWSSPHDWEVVQTRITDLNHDGNPEVTLLLWREFSPWPIDAYIPHPGRIRDFHDRENRSCHLILIGWSRGAYRELWAGSALADPLLAFTPVDLDRDGQQELIALESRYDARFLERSSITIWEWNGFGFTLLTRGPKGYFHSLTTVQSSTGQELLLAQGILWR